MSAEARREQLLDMALVLIARDGYRAVTVERVARELGVTRPVVYNVFADADALLAALLARQEERAVSQLLATLAPISGDGDYGAYVRSTVAALARIVGGDPATWHPIFAAHPGTPAAVRDQIAAAREVVRLRIESLLLAAAQAGATDPALDSVLASHALIGVGEHFGRLLVEDPAQIDPVRLADTIAAMLGL